jgi:formylglycine-generating enzyme required for sulfatase activity
VNFCDANCGYDWKDTDYDDGYERTSPVKGFESGAGWCGALNMAGNVWEWVDDWYDAYLSTAQTDPTGPDVGDYKVLRGGSWYSILVYIRAAYRNYLMPVSRDSYVGLRCVVEPGW